MTTLRVQKTQDTEALTSYTAIVAIEKRTGRTLWTNTEINDPIGYCSPVAAHIEGVKQIITLSAKRVLSFDPNAGHLLWEYEFGNKRDNNATDVTVNGGMAYA